MPILLILSIILNIHLYCNPRIKVEKEKEIVTDTIIEWRYSTDTIYLDKVNTKYEYKYITINDTVYIENKPQHYTDTTSNYTFEAQAVKLDWYKLDVHKTDTVTQTKIEYVYNKGNKRKIHFNHGIQFGVGYGLINNKPDVFIGYGFQFNF